METLIRVRNYNHFLEKIVNLSESRKRSINLANKKFNTFVSETYNKTTDQIIQQVKSLEGDEKEDLLEDVVQSWINSLKRENIGRKAIKVYLSGVNRYLKYNKLRVDSKDLELPPSMQEERYAISLEEIHKILRASSWNKQGYYLALISTGARPMEIIGLRTKDITWTGTKYKALIPAHLTKKKISRTVFFSKEVTPYLSKFLKGKEDNDTIFTDNPNLEHARNNEDLVLAQCRKRIGFTEKYETTGFSKINLYCFRGYFFTRVLRLVGGDTAHAMIGHGAYIQEYQRRTDEEKEELWNEIEPEILIYDLTKKDHQIKKLKEANSKIDDLAKQVEEIKKQQFETQKVLTHTIVEGTIVDLEEYMDSDGKRSDKVWKLKNDLDDRLYKQLDSLKKATGKKYQVKIEEIDEEE